MSTTSQHNRFLTIETPLGADTLLLQSFTASESVSSLFNFHLDLLSEKSFIPLDALIGKPVTITLELADGSQRFFHGIVNRFGQSGRGPAGRDSRFTCYYAEVVPRLWFLTCTTDCRIFQNMTVPEVIKKIFQDLGLRDFRDALIRSYTKWDYCVQYRETDFNFISRLMEQEGIFYFFEHERGKHTLVLADSPDAHQPCPGQPQALFSPEGGIGDEEDTVTAWQMEQGLRPGTCTLRDYHFEMPSKSLEVSTATTLPVGGNDKFQLYDYPGEYAQRFNKPGERLSEVEPEGDKVVNLRMQEEETSELVINGSSTCRVFSAGFRFDLLEPPPGVTAGPYVLTSVQHSATQGGDFVSGLETGVSYSNDFTCMPHRVPYRPARVTPKPMVQGPQTAVVVGRQGEEIDCDKYGRVRVQFHWDREGQKNENSSCFVRVAQLWAGKQWGAIFIPRVGQEVVVDFLEGDPNQPIIVGSVYNAEQMPPYKLPENKTQSGIKSRSSKDGSPANFNELRFEDKKGSEDVYFHAEKDFHRVVENNDDLKVGNDQTIEIEKGSREVQIDMGNDTLTIKMGNQTTKLDLGKSETEAMQSIELKVGQSSVKLDQTGVTIKGMMITVEGQIQTQVKGTITQVNGSAMLQVQGGVVMLN